MSLRSSALHNGIEVDPIGIVDPDVDTRVFGGRELISLGRTAVLAEPTEEATLAVAETLGGIAAASAVEVAGAFQMINRVVEATGQPVLAGQMERMRPQLEALGALDFAGASLTTERGRTGWDAVRHRIERRLGR